MFATCKIYILHGDNISERTPVFNSIAEGTCKLLIYIYMEIIILIFKKLPDNEI